MEEQSSQDTQLGSRDSPQATELFNEEVFQKWFDDYELSVRMNGGQPDRVLAKDIWKAALGSLKLRVYADEPTATEAEKVATDLEVLSNDQFPTDLQNLLITAAKVIRLWLAAKLDYAIEHDTKPKVNVAVKKVSMDLNDVKRKWLTKGN